jgi:hypothetical protein
VAQQEVLAVITDAEGEQALRHLANGLRITQRVSPRVALVTGPEAGIRKLAATSGIEIVDRNLSVDALERLDQTEALFAKAWRQRTADAAEVRRGDGLAWDAPGYEPPDPLTRRGR